MSSKRIYNIFFNLHTVSGIVISVALYIIFLAGAFSLFKEEIHDWENDVVEERVSRREIDYDRVLNFLDEEFALKGRDLQANLTGNDNSIKVYFSGRKDTVSNNENSYYIVDSETLNLKTYENDYSLGEFLYRLHFFHQIPYVGIYIAGLVALFMLFALGAGLVIHWKKIVSNFYTFQPKQKLNRIWSSAHTALGVLGFPFQIVIGVTGAYFCLNFLVLAPALALYEGDQNKLMEDLLPAKRYVKWENASKENIPSFNSFITESCQIWNNFEPTNFYIKNYAGSNAEYIISGNIYEDNIFNAKGRVSLSVIDNKLTVEKNPFQTNFIEDFQSITAKLHFASFGGISIKLVYFLLSLITCFVIISGVLLWVEARNKKNISLEKRIYTTNVGHVYTAICLSILPVTAASFIFVKFLPKNIIDKTIPIYLFFFISWFLMSFYLRYKRDHYFTNRLCLLLTSIFGFLIPLSFVVTSKSEFSFVYNSYSINLINALWLFISLLSLFIYIKINPEIKKQSSYYKLPIQKLNFKKYQYQDQILTNLLPMQTKIIFLWLTAAILWIIHHIYGLFNIYYVDSLMIEGSDGTVPVIHHIYRILFEGSCLLFAILSIQITKKGFLLTAFVWASLAALYNLYHLITAIIYESDNISEIFMLVLMILVSYFLVYNYYLLLFKNTK